MNVFRRLGFITHPGHSRNEPEAPQAFGSQFAMIWQPENFKYLSDLTIFYQDVKREEDEANRRLFVLQIVQPGLAGLMDGSVSTLAPVFAAAIATQKSWDAFVVGLAASIGAGISMGFAEALSDDGSLTGRGRPWVRGVICGLMTALGGLGHTMPYLVPDSWPNAFWIATAIAGVVVFFELWAIAYIRARYMDTPFLQAVFQIVLGGAIVLAVGILIGAA